MSIDGERESSHMDPFPPDPLLKAGAFIDPHPSSNGNSGPESASGPSGPADRWTSQGTPQPSGQKVGSDPPPADGSQLEKPDWLPPGWTVEEKVRVSGASAGTRDKYYVDTTTKRRFRSKKEVLLFLETGSTPLKRKKNADSDGDTMAQANSQTPKKKPEVKAKAKDIAKHFNFVNAPAKVKWELTDVYEGTWLPLLNGVDRVPESSVQEWGDVFTYLTLNNGGSIQH